MQLQNPFPQTVRLLYLGVWKCVECGRNGWSRGGLSLHHILGRISASALNSALVCGTCHGHMGHTRAEHQRLFFKTIRFLKGLGYAPTAEDWSFLGQNYQELVSSETELWLTK